MSKAGDLVKGMCLVGTDTEWCDCTPASGAIVPCGVSVVITPLRVGPARFMLVKQQSLFPRLCPWVRVTNTEVFGNSSVPPANDFRNVFA